MINTRLSIFSSLRKKIKLILRHAAYDSDGFKTILYAVILNDMKEWSEYIPNSNHSKQIVEILNNYILEHKDFIIERFIDNEELYVNTNTPQDNTTWSRIWDNSNVKEGKLDTSTSGTDGSATFRVNGTTLGFYPQANGTYASNTLNVQLHDKTLFE